jgi:2-polyprenyl-6-hydroxyphenyl methylase/3-demethylubiquinone-9 3-methyltransferase
MMHTENTVNENPAELAKFDQGEAAWWDEQGPFWTLHAINPLRLAFLQRHADLAGQRILDVGAGGGILAEAMARCGASVTGLERSPAALETARQHAADNHLTITYLDRTVEEFAGQEPAAYDGITCMELLEHVPDPVSVVKACGTLLKPGGWACFSTINRTPAAFALAIGAAEYLLGWVPKGTHRYAQLIRPSELAAWVRQADLQVSDICGMGYVPGFGFFLGGGVAVNYLMMTTKPT